LCLSNRPLLYHILGAGKPLESGSCVLDFVLSEPLLALKLIPMKLIPEELTNEHCLLLICARKVLTPPQLEQAGAAIAAGLDWDLLARHAQHHGLSPLLYSHLQRDFPLAVSTRPEPRLKLLETGVRNLFLSAALLKILDALQTAGIRALAYKGPALAVSLYGDIKLREMSDLDILIERAAFRAAREVLVQLGYESASRYSRKQQEARLRSDCQCEFSSSDGNVLVDLHWQITAPHLAHRFRFGDLWDRRRTVTLGQKSVPTFSAEDTALLLAVHGGKHLWERLSWLADFAESLRQTPPPFQNIDNRGFDWRELKVRAREARAERMLLLALALAEDVMQVQIPPEFSAAIRNDNGVQATAASIARKFFEDFEDKDADTEDNPALLPAPERWLTLVQLADSRWDGIRSAARFALASGPREWQTIRLPDSLFAFYRLLRLATVLRNAPTFFFPGRRPTPNSG
jgi:Uncharacterised nucleotidyltransferase